MNLDGDYPDMSSQRKILWGDFLRLRGLRYAKLCNDCKGLGVMCYGHGSTWRGGMGTAAMTYDVCDKCWGSGDAEHPWPSQREFEEMKKIIKDLEERLETGR